MEAAAKTRKSSTNVNPTPKQAAGRNSEELVRLIYRKLGEAFGQQHWWPAESPFEVVVGAILTQNTSWKNVERALTKLRQAGALKIEAIRELPVEELQELLRSSGYYRQKAARLKIFVSFVDSRHGGSLDRMVATDTGTLRTQLLGLKGIGPETADAILLYAGMHSVFVVDAYARRIFARHEAITDKASYEEIRMLTEIALAAEQVHAGGSPPGVPGHQPTTMSRLARHQRAGVYSEMHGLLVQTGKLFCHRHEPRCEACPLGSILTSKQRARLLAS